MFLRQRKCRFFERKLELLLELLLDLLLDLQ
jgi:hypothetical protein